MLFNEVRHASDKLKAEIIKAAGGMSILHRDFDGTRLQLQTHLAIVESKTRKALDAARRAHEAGWDAA